MDVTNAVLVMAGTFAIGILMSFIDFFENDLLAAFANEVEAAILAVCAIIVDAAMFVVVVLMAPLDSRCSGSEVIFIEAMNTEMWEQTIFVFEVGAFTQGLLWRNMAWIRHRNLFTNAANLYEHENLVLGAPSNFSWIPNMYSCKNHMRIMKRSKPCIFNKTGDTASHAELRR